MATDMLGPLRSLHVTPANVDDRAEVDKLSGVVQEASGEAVELIFVHQGYAGGKPADAAAQHGIQLGVVKPTGAKKKVVPISKRRVVERFFPWIRRCRCLVKDNERYAPTLAGFCIVAFVCLMLK